MAWGGPLSDGNRFGFRVDDNRMRGEFSGGNIQGASIVNDGGWHHVAITVQANATVSYPEVALWVDGQDDTLLSTDDTIVNILAESDARIGMNPSYEGRWFGGLIDELYLYDRVLTPEEIAGAAGRSTPFDQ
ncbi:LamG domain-containing protein [Planctomycetota bacterium]